jgi:probable addiction module antidote protein
MTETFADFDPAEYLSSPEAIAEFMNDALETGDADYIAKVRKLVARAKEVTELAMKTRLSREQLH